MTLSLMVIIGLFPNIFINALQRPVSLFTHDTVFNFNLIKVGAIDSLQTISWLFGGLIIFVLAIIGLRKFVSRKKIIETGPTWGCGYSNATSKMQYTASSYVRSYSKVAKPVLDIEKREVEVVKIFPTEKHYETDPYDKIERIFIDYPLKLVNKITDLFAFLQNGRLQAYILYGIIFISSVIIIPVVFDKIAAILHFLNNL